MLAGLAASLATVGYDHALSAGVTTLEASADHPDLISVTIATEDGDDAVAIPAKDAVAKTKAALAAATGTYKTDVSLWAATPMLFIVGDLPRNTYLLDADSAQDTARLVQGTWPKASSAGTLEVALPVSAASALGAKIGDTYQLGATARPAENDPGNVKVVVVGTFVPTDATAWERDPLRGAGVNSTADRLPAFGPMVVAPGTLVESSMPIGRLSAIVNPELDGDFSGLAVLTRSTGGT